MKRFLILLSLVMLASICLAQVLNPPAWISFTRTGDTTGEIRWAVDPTGWADYYYFGLHPSTTPFGPPNWCDPGNWNVPGGWASSFTLETPTNYVRTITTGIVAGPEYYAYVASVRTTTGWNWACTSSFDSPPTLPVELSSFTATITAQNYVKLTWVSQSETGLLGYRVYRSETANQADATSITPIMIPATNTSTTQTYNHSDEEVVIGNTYYYWLESVDMGHSDFHGPVNVLVTGETPPVLPEYTTMRNAYPNPFIAADGTNIEINLKAGETGVVTIYNVAGQAVKTYNVNEGFNTLSWNGKDGKGNLCGSGIYFYKLSSPSLNQTKKMIILR